MYYWSPVYCRNLRGKGIAFFQQLYQGLNLHDLIRQWFLKALTSQIGGKKDSSFLLSTRNLSNELILLQTPLYPKIINYNLLRYSAIYREAWLYKGPPTFQNVMADSFKGVFLSGEDASTPWTTRRFCGGPCHLMMSYIHGGVPQKKDH